MSLAPIALPLLAWYDANRRALPFREDPTPYHVWVSEIMLQQTQVAAALPYYRRFVAALPNVAALAACDEERLHKLWEGLGYYSRVRNMQRAARLVVERHAGRLPADYGALLALPGIGPYTAGAIASIAFGLPHTAVDGNVLRVAARLLACEGDVALPDTKKALEAAVAEALPAAAPGDFNQALMELGALVCTPRTPRCGACPLAALCLARQRGTAEQLPVKSAAKPRAGSPICLLVVRGQQGVLLQRRPQGGLLAGLWQPVLLQGRYTKAQAGAALQALLPGVAPGRALPKASHVFTHRVWYLYGWLCTAPPGAAAPDGYRFVPPGEVRQSYALPSAFKAYRPFLE